MKIQLQPSPHFQERLESRFGAHYYNIPIDKFEWVSLTTPNRADHVKLLWKLAREAETRPYFNKRYLVSKEYNIVIPVSDSGRMLTAIYYKRGRKWNKTEEDMKIN